MLSRAEIESLPSLSYRARIAYSLSCIERLVAKLDLRGARFDEWLERAWRRTSSPKADWRIDGWPMNFTEIDALFEPPAFGWDGIGDALRRTFDLARNCCESILERSDGSSGTEQLRAIVVEITRNGVTPPDPAVYARSPSSEMAGWGRSVPPFFFRESVDRENFVPRLVAFLRSDERLRRRAAAQAAGHLGMGSEELEHALVAVLQDSDSDVARLAEESLRRLGRYEEAVNAAQVRRAEEARAQRSAPPRLPPPLVVDEASMLRSLASADRMDRETAIRHASWLSTDAISAALRDVARTDTVAKIRALAALAIAEDLVSRHGAEAVLRDPDDEVRAAAVPLFAGDAPHAFPGAATLFRLLSETEAGSRMAGAILERFSVAQPAKKADLVLIAVETNTALETFLRIAETQRHKRFFSLARKNAERLLKDSDDLDQKQRALTLLDSLAEIASRTW